VRGDNAELAQHREIVARGPVFDDAPKMRRLRLGACLLADVAWQANPGFRADRAIEMALHGNWVAVTPAERVILAQALSSNFGRDRLPDPRMTGLCSAEKLDRAHQWGVAMRLGQRFSGGVGPVLSRSRLVLGDGQIELHIAEAEEALAGDPVQRRLARLADAVGCGSAVVVT
jgi:exopolyphosphatase/guanosine-5'-triphosphate,3'-diphosphate pyrophosphatase